MSTEIKKAATPEQRTAAKNIQQQKSYQNKSEPSRLSSDRLQKIAEYKQQIPKAYQAVYERAVAGKSLRAAINAQCLECCGWQRKEITLCTALACPLWEVRSYQKILQEGVK